MIKVYIASPYSIGDKTENVLKSINASNELMDEGFAPFVPLMFPFQDIVHPRKHEDWMTLDIEWLSVCDAVLRLEGESKGADLEVEYARDHSIPVFYTIEQIKEYYLDKA